MLNYVPMIDGGVVRPLEAREVGDLPIDACAVSGALILAGAPLIPPTAIRADARRLRWTAATDDLRVPAPLRGAELATSTAAHRIHPSIGTPHRLGYGRMHVHRLSPLPVLKLIASTVRLLVATLSDDLIDLCVAVPQRDVLELLIEPEKTVTPHPGNVLTCREITVVRQTDSRRVVITGFTHGEFGDTSYHLLGFTNERLTSSGILIATNLEPEFLARWLASWLA